MQFCNKIVWWQFTEKKSASNKTKKLWYLDWTQFLQTCCNEWLHYKNLGLNHSCFSLNYCNKCTILQILTIFIKITEPIGFLWAFFTLLNKGELQNQLLQQNRNWSKKLRINYEKFETYSSWLLFYFIIVYLKFFPFQYKKYVT